MTVHAWLRAPLTHDPERRRTYPDDVYFREMAAFLDGWETDRADRALLGSTFVMFKPDAVVGRRIEPALAFLAGHGFEPLGALTVRVDARVCRELWRYQINAAPLAVIRAVDMVLESGPPCLFVALRDIRGPRRTGTSAAERLAELKGSSKNRSVDGGSLRGVLGCELMCLNFLHAPDDPADLMREVGVLLPGRREEALSLLAADVVPRGPAEPVAVARALYAAHPAHPLTPPASTGTSRRPADPGSLLARVEELASGEGGLPLWDRIVIAADLVEGLPSEGRPLIGPPPGKRLTHPRTVRSTGPTAPAAADR
ncbi:nucleoside-diphosphate kinase [Streptomyces sp. NPDC021080]|uniref:nucleoside-diphosphate kinase n=1 Tax=Streptomyces sp. NPDC021080 TaxID=3365110 RepID=UPI0037B38066